MGWNGQDLVDDFAAELSDTSSAFETKVLRWINEGLRDIATSHEWPFLRARGQAILAASTDTNSLVPVQPTAPSVSATSGGALTADSAYTVLVTYYEGVAEVESIAGVASASVTPTGANLTISVTSIPVSTWPLVTARKIYLSKAGAAYYLYETISNNTATTTTITADTTSTVTPPDQWYISKLDGDLYLENTQVLEGYSLQRLRYETNGVVNTAGTPSVWASINQTSVAVYPRPSANTTLSFYYFKLPAQVFNSSTSVPQIPSFMYEALHDYVIWRGFQYRDRAGQESKRANYDSSFRIQVSRKGTDKKRSGRVRSVTPDSDGYAT
jgi:hypothetical protein